MSLGYLLIEMQDIIVFVEQYLPIDINSSQKPPKHPIEYTYFYIDIWMFNNLSQYSWKQLLCIKMNISDLFFACMLHTSND